MAAFEERPASRPAREAGACVTLLVLNVYLMRELFRMEYLNHLRSVEGSFIALTRFLMQHPFQLSWWPFWDAGLPFQHTYFPLLSAMAALAGRAAGWSPARAFHAVSALLYCLGPVTLFLMARRLSGRSGASFGAALAYSLLSPAALLMPAIAADTGGAWYLRRLHTFVYYGEIPHLAALTLVPLVVLFLDRGFEMHRPRDYVAAGMLAAAVALTNAFAASAVVAGVLCLLVTKGAGEFWKNLGRATAIAGAAYLLVCPLIPPSLLRAVLFNVPKSGGDFSAARLSQSALALLVGLAGLIWLGTRHWRDSALRLFLLWAVLASGPPLLASAADIYVVPQPARYSVEMEMALCLAGAFAAGAVSPRLPVPARAAVLAGLIALAARQTIVSRRQARNLLRPVAVTETIEYQTARWMEQHLDGRRVMACGSGALWLNVFTDLPQLSGGHEPLALNPVQLVAVFIIYSGLNAGPRDGVMAVQWLKAFGVHAVHVSGPQGREYYKPFANPYKFEGLLPVLWRQGDDTIYQVPQRSASLAHVIPAGAVVGRTPEHGLDIEPLLPYTAALDNPALPAAEMQWEDFGTAQIRARLEPGQVVSVQVNYHPGWHATVEGRPQPVSPDGLGLVVIRPRCEGPCEIRLSYDGGVEFQGARALSLLTIAGVLLWLARRRF